MNSDNFFNAIMYCMIGALGALVVIPSIAFGWSFAGIMVSVGILYAFNCLGRYSHMDITDILKKSGIFAVLGIICGLVLLVYITISNF